MYRQPAVRKGAPQQVSSTTSLPSPVGGWNARDSVAVMPTTDAVTLTNFFPTVSDVLLRKGCVDHVTGFGSVPQSLLPFQSPTVRKLFAATATDIYDATSAGAVGSAEVSSLTSGKWQHVNFAIGGTHYLYIVNGADNPQHYNGSVWASPSITGVTKANLVHINMHKRRLWFVEKSSMKAWYLAVDSIAGAATSFDLGPLFALGGELTAMATWSLDAGSGLDDHAVFISSQGEVAIYTGTDPSNANTWQLIGVYRIGAPIGRRCFTKYGGDLLVLTVNGVFPLSTALQSARIQLTQALTDKISSAMSLAAGLYGTNFGWEMQVYPDANMLLMNVPVTTTTSQQYVMNTITKSWCNFTGWDATCFAQFDPDGLGFNVLYFATDTKVVAAWSGESDYGSNIVGEALQAFDYMGTRAALKQFRMVRPIIRSNGVPGVLLGMNTDFDTTTPVGTPTFASPTFAVWDTSTWDAGIWSGGLDVRRDWQSVNAVGYCGAIHMVIASSVLNVNWASSDVVYEVGGVV